MTRPAVEDLDGVSLGYFQVGLTYEVSPAIATYLITTECAEPVSNELTRTATEIRYGYNIALRPAIAADRT